MNSSLSPSTPMTEGQIGKVQELIGAELRKHRSEFSSDVTQSVLTQKGAALQAEFLSAFRRFVELLSDMIVRTVLVKRGRTPQEAIAATGRVQYVDSTVVADMPGGDGKNRRAPVTFFKVGRYLTDAELEQEYEARGLMPADPYALAAVNETDPAFADEHPNSTHWKDGNGNWCFAAFHRRGDERYVKVNRDRNGWDFDWWFAGVPVEKSQDSST